MHGRLDGNRFQGTRAGQRFVSKVEETKKRLDGAEIKQWQEK